MRHCKLCGQALRTQEAVERTRAHGRHARRLPDSQRQALREALLERERRLQASGKSRLTGYSMREIAERHGCSRRTAIRERAWMVSDGSIK